MRKGKHRISVGEIIFSFALLAVVSAGSAGAEGFPGKGDRGQYAESLLHYNLGNRYLEKQWYEKAVEKYTDAINIYPYDADAYTNLSVACRKLGDIAGAVAACRKAVDLNDSDWTSWSNLANLLMTQDNFTEAYRCFNKALKCNIPPSEKTFIESNIEGMKKIMKARGLSIEGNSLMTPLAVPGKIAPAGARAGAIAEKPHKPGEKPDRKPSRPTPDSGASASRNAMEQDLDPNALNEWVGN
jgi:tetratricopeptide (TPR) repeat protein